MDEIYVPRRRRKPKKNYTWLVILAAILLLGIVIGAVIGLVRNKDDGEKPPATTTVPTTTAQPPKYAVSLMLDGAEEMTVEFGTAFEDPGAQGFYWDEKHPEEKMPAEVTVQSNLDATKLGTYTITYSVQQDDATETLTRTVHIVDTTPPEITLVADPDRVTLPGETYSEEGFTAVDNYDGDITDKVVRKEEKDRIIYTVKDSSGNETTVIRSIFRDEEAPVLTLKGNKVVTVISGMGWKDLGATATDNVEGDISRKVKVTGTVDLNKVGTYYLTYRVSDGSGNTAELKRTVVVRDLVYGEPNGKVIYLTFDDGPSNHTPQLLETLEKYGAKATFFVCNTGRLDLLDDIAKGGHALAIHTMSHRYDQIYASEAAYFKDLTGMRELIKKYSGVDTTLMRFPGGSSNSISKNYCPGIMTTLTKRVVEEGYYYFDWHVDSNDAGGAKTSDKIAENVITGIQNRPKSTQLVVLQHDIYQASVEAVEQILIWGLENGYTFLALDEESSGAHHPVYN